MKIKSDADEPSIKQSLNELLQKQTMPHPRGSSHFRTKKKKKKKQRQQQKSQTNTPISTHSLVFLPFRGINCLVLLLWHRLKNFLSPTPDFSRLFLTPKYFATKLLQHITLKMRLIESQTRSLS